MPYEKSTSYSAVASSELFFVNKSNLDNKCPKIIFVVYCLELNGLLPKKTSSNMFHVFWFTEENNGIDSPESTIGANAGEIPYLLGFVGVFFKKTTLYNKLSANFYIHIK